MVVLPYLSVIQFDGADAGSFLHNQLSADVLALANNDSVFACYCEPKGRVLALMLICKLDECYYVVMSSALSAAVTARLKIYVMRSDVNIELLKDMTVAGIKAKQKPVLPKGAIHTIPVPGNDQWLMISGQQLEDEDTSVQDSWKLLELQGGISWLSPETSGQFLPQMLGFDKIGAVNFRKGCYPGQEIVARTHYLGKVKRHPRLLNASGPVCPDPLEKIQLISGEGSHEAVVIDSACVEGGSNCMLVISRIDPGLPVDQFDHKGLITSVLPENLKDA